MPFPRSLSIRLQPALAEFVRKYRLPEEECVLLLRATTCTLFVRVRKEFLLRLDREANRIVRTAS